MQDARITAADVAGPGFLNLRLAPAVWQGIVKKPSSKAPHSAGLLLGQAGG